jgi:hypothetical protein
VRAGAGPSTHLTPAGTRPQAKRMSTFRTVLILAALGFAFGYLTGCADETPPCLAMAPEQPLALTPGPAVPHAWMAGRPPYVIDAQGSAFPAALAAIERINALAGGRLIVAGTRHPVAVLENVNLGSSDIGGQTDCNVEPCRVQTNFRQERDTLIWEHELVHALGYRGDNPNDPAHDLSGLMQPVNPSAVVSDAIAGHLRGLLATAVRCGDLLVGDDTACL